MSHQKTDNSEGGFNVGHATNLVNTSVDAFKAFVDLKKEEEVTRRVIIQGQKEIHLGEQALEKARMDQSVRFDELDKQDKEGMRNHEHAMKTLDLQEQKLESKGDFQDRVLKQFEAKEITAEEAAHLLQSRQD